MTGHPLTALPQWQALARHAAAMGGVHMRDLFAAEAGRFERFSLGHGGLLLDYSKNRITAETMDLLTAFARARRVEQGRAAMFAGGKINSTEDRAAFHVALRAGDGPMTTGGRDVMDDVRKTRLRLKAFSDAVRSGQWKGSVGMPIRHVVNIGIGGSHLGPMVVAEALKDHADKDLSLVFVSNPDPAQLRDGLNGYDPATTLFIVSSKTFTTAETMAIAHAARDWLVSSMGEEAVKRHFVAVTANAAAAALFGIPAENVFPIWDWVGGRYSVWSAIALPVILSCGYDVFAAFLDGGRAMDRHFADAPLERNMPVLMALLGQWYTDFFDAPAMAVLPYDYRLRLLPLHVQQLDMESNGKGVMADGTPVATKAGPVVFGGGGSDSQHSFFQLLHQSPRLIPCDFIVAARGARHYPPEEISGRDLIVANAFAQSEALMKGRDGGDLAGMPEKLRPHRSFTGNRPSNTLLLDGLTPGVVGQLVALYEHKVFVQGLLWGVNSFDQWGVELGKEMAMSLAPALQGAPLGLRDSSTAGLVAAYRAAKE